MTTQTNNKSDAESSQDGWRQHAEFVLWLAVAIFVAVAVGVVIIQSVRLFAVETWVRFLAVLTIVAVFPVSYAAYQRLRSDVVIKRLEVEFKLLGLDERSRFNITDQISVSDLYNTVYNPWQYSLFITLIIIVSIFVLMAGGPHVEPTMGLPIHIPAVDNEQNSDQAAGDEITAAPAPANASEVTTTQAISPGVTGATISMETATAADAAAGQSTTITLVLIAYLGAYVYSVQELVRRYNTFDLQPQVYSSIFVRMIVAVILVFVGSSAIVAFGPTVGEGAPEPAAGYASVWAPGIIAFIIGAFPSRGLRWFSDLAERAMGSSGQTSAELPISNIEGMSTWHAARLQQMGIDDAQNLAHSEFRRLLLTTPFDPKIIINWVDQAILYAKVGDKITNFRNAKIKTFYELQSELQRLRSASRQTAGAAAGNAAQPNNALLLLAKAVGVEDEAALLRLGDESSYPNSHHIAFYYDNIGLRIWRQATEALRDDIVGRIKDIKAGVAATTALDEKLRATVMKSKSSELMIALGEAYYERGIQAARTGDNQAGQDNLQQALEMLQEAVKFDPNNAAGHFSLGLCHIGLRDYQMAVDDCNRAIAIDPGYAQAFSNRGLAFVQLDRDDQAERDFDEALHLDDRLSEAYYNRGLLRNALGRHADALIDFRRAYWTGYEEPRVRLGIASAYMGQGNFVEAESEFTKVLFVAPGLVDAYLGRSSAYVNMGADHYDQAAQDLASALARDDNNLQVRYNFARLQLARGNEKEARLMYQSIVDRDAELKTPEAREAAIWLAAHP